MCGTLHKIKSQLGNIELYPDRCTLLKMMFLLYPTCEYITSINLLLDSFLS